jgi:Asp-tRNA(Asn)/Glu-tRNA(Gln) amidotransferase A subunit family amidase
MDKIGPICHTVEDCALVFNAIHGSDQNDSTTINATFNWNRALDPTKVGFDLEPVTMPDINYQSLAFVLTTESAVAFDDLTRSNRDDELIKSNWPRAFRAARFVPAVEYIQANRVRTILIREMAETMQDVDLFITPWGKNILLGNLTGHPFICLPDGFNKRGMPTSIGFFGKLYGESELLAVAKLFQDSADHHLKDPRAFS